MVKIYCIEDINGLKYVGSTIQPLNVRLNHHKCHNACMSRELNLDDCKIYTLEECQEEQRKEREQYWINHTECVNKFKAFRDKKEYEKEYYKENKDYLNQRKKEYYNETKYQLNHYHYKKTWGGDPRTHNNLLKIDLNIFL
jgi:hypothetical protein